MKKVTKVVVAAALLVGGIVAPVTIYFTHAAANTKIESVQKDHKQTIAQTVELAKQGKAINSENFGLQSSGQEIQKKWGKPSESSDNEHLYYPKKKISFELKNDKVVKIGSLDEKYWDITVDEVRKSIAQTPKEKRGEDTYYLEYKFGDRVLEFAFYYDENNKPDTIQEVLVR